MTATVIYFMVQPAPAIRGQPLQFQADVFVVGTGVPLANVPVVLSFIPKGSTIETILGTLVTDVNGAVIGEYTFNIGGEVTFYATFPGSTDQDPTYASVTVDLICGDCETGDVISQTCWDGEVIPYKVCGGNTCWEDSDIFTCNPQPVDKSMYLLAAGAVIVGLGLMLK